MEQKNEIKKAKPTYGMAIVDEFLGTVKEFALKEQTPLTEKEINFAVNIITSIDKKLIETGTGWKGIDVVGCRLPQQIKRYARLGLSLDDNEIYIDIRNNSKTGLKDINIKKQYQGLEKEIVKFCSKKVVRFYSDVICTNDDFEMQVDFTTGLQKVVKHTKDNSIDRNALENIVGAYKIAYVEENNELHQYIAYIDKNRIMRAYNASPSREKTVWKNDTRIMVLKTATWVLYNNVLKPYMQIPADLMHDWKETNDVMEFENDNQFVGKTTNSKVKVELDDIDVIDVDMKIKDNEADIESKQ